MDIAPQDIEIRWMIRSDMPEVLDIENSSFGQPWSKDDFLCCMRDRSILGCVADVDDVILGFMIYELQKRSVSMLNLAVKPEYRRCGVGKAMVESQIRMVEKLSAKRKRIHARVVDRNLAAHQFFAACGFSAIEVLKGSYGDCPDDAYLFEYRAKGPARVPANRIKRWLPTGD